MSRQPLFAMDIEEHVIPFFQWLFGSPGGSNGAPSIPSALGTFLSTTLILFFFSLLFGYFISSIRHGPLKAFGVVREALWQGCVDLVRMSPRRVLGLTYLAMREAFRSRIWVSLVVYAIVLMFAGWVLSPDNSDPAKLYLNFVLTATTYLMLTLTLLLCSFSLPAEIKSKTIYTLVTKPVRASEIVLGRILGFTLVCTILLLVMGVVSYFFVGRMLNHEHELLQSELKVHKEDSKIVRYTGMTSEANNHRHRFAIEANSFSPGFDVRPTEEGVGLKVTQTMSAVREAGLNVDDTILEVNGTPITPSTLGDSIGQLQGTAGSRVKLKVLGPADSTTRNLELTRLVALATTDVNKGHRHPVTARWIDNQIQYEVGPAEGMLTARVPIYGNLRFRDARGDRKDPTTWSFKDKGISVGKVFAYRSYIKGNTLAAAVWTFEGLNREDFEYGLPLDMNVRVYRSHMGKIDEGVTGSVIARNPDTRVRCQAQLFTAREYNLDRLDIPRDLTDKEGRPIDLVEDLISRSMPDLTLVGTQIDRPGQPVVATATQEVIDAGVKPGDLILEIDGQPTDKLSARTATSLLSGDQGTEVRLSIRSAEDPQPREVVLSRTTEPGRLEVWMRCAQQGQYFGLARADVYVRGKDASYTINFIKGHFEIWLQVLIVTSLAVMFSTTLSGPIAMLLTVTTVILGFFTSSIFYLTNCVLYRPELKVLDILRRNRMTIDEEGITYVREMKRSGVKLFDDANIDKLWEMKALGLDQIELMDRFYGGGPLEAMFRIVTKENLLTKMEDGYFTNTIVAVDRFLMHFLQSVLRLLPDFGRLSDVDYLAHGYNIQSDLVFQHGFVTLAFAFSAVVGGYFLFKLREVAK